MITIEPSANAAPTAAISPSGLSRFLNRARQAVGIAGEIEVLLACDSTLRRLNKTFRGKDKATDVLSFPSPEEISLRHAGDLAISIDTAARQAAAYGHSLRDEIRILLLHGLLHLSGLDHETDNGEMAARETALRHQLKLPQTLIARTRQKARKAADRKRKPPSPARPGRREAAMPHGQKQRKQRNTP